MNFLCIIYHLSENLKIQFYLSNMVDIFFVMWYTVLENYRSIQIASHLLQRAYSTQIPSHSNPNSPKAPLSHSKIYRHYLLSHHITALYLRQFQNLIIILPIISARKKVNQCQKTNTNQSSKKPNRYPQASH